MTPATTESTTGKDRNFCPTPQSLTVRHATQSSSSSSPTARGGRCNHCHGGGSRSRRSIFNEPRAVLRLWLIKSKHSCKTPVWQLHIDYRQLDGRGMRGIDGRWPSERDTLCCQERTLHTKSEINFVSTNLLHNRLPAIRL